MIINNDVLELDDPLLTLIDHTIFSPLRRTRLSRATFKLLGMIMLWFGTNKDDVRARYKLIVAVAAAKPHKTSGRDVDTTGRRAVGRVHGRHFSDCAWRRGYRCCDVVASMFMDTTSLVYCSSPCLHPWTFCSN